MPGVEQPERPLHPELKKAEWEHSLPEILKSPRVVEMTFHVPQVDKDYEFITADAMSRALEDYKYFPIISEFHKERPIGVAERIWQTQDDEFKAFARIRTDPSVDDVWEKIRGGKYNQVSIAGRRLEYSPECSLHKSVRSVDRPCTTTGLRLDSISVCDEAARNDMTDLHVVKAGEDDPAAFVWTTSLELKQVEVDLTKADTTDSSLMHVVTDGTKLKAGDTLEKDAKKCNQKPVKKGEEEDEEKESEEEKKEEKAEQGEPEKTEMEKADPMTEVLNRISSMEKILQKLVDSDKKVHESMKAEDEKPEEGKEKKVEKAEVPPTPPVQPAMTQEQIESMVKAKMEQDIQKAISDAVSPLTTKIEQLEKALTETKADLEKYANTPIEKAAVRIYELPVDHEGNPVTGNAGALARQMKGTVKK